MIVCGKCGTKNADWIKKCNGCNHVFGGRVFIPATALVKKPVGSTEDGLVRISAPITKNVFFVCKGITGVENECRGFVRKGDFLDVDIGAGFFRLELALGGDEWRGEEHLFGPSTMKLAIDSPLEIKSGGLTVTGYFIEFRNGEISMSRTEIPKLTPPG